MSLGDGKPSLIVCSSVVLTTRFLVATIQIDLLEIPSFILRNSKFPSSTYQVHIIIFAFHPNKRNVAEETMC